MTASPFEIVNLGIDCLAVGESTVRHAGIGDADPILTARGRDALSFQLVFHYVCHSPLLLHHLTHCICRIAIERLGGG